MKKTIEFLKDKKRRSVPITMMTCYDYPTACCLEKAGIDVVFVGDSVGTNILGYENETQVTMDDIEHHLKAVRRGIKDAYLLADLPYMAYSSREKALENAARLLKLGADGVKLEGPLLDIVESLSAQGIVVWGHLGLTPQTQTQKKLQAKSTDAAITLVENALEMERAGASIIVFEMIPEEVARAASELLSIPTIGIGAGRYTDGQVLIVCDMLGINEFDLRHSVKYEDFHGRALKALRQYAQDVLTGEFPGEDNARHLDQNVLEEFIARASRVQRIQSCQSNS